MPIFRRIEPTSELTSIKETFTSRKESINVRRKDDKHEYMRQYNNIWLKERKELWIASNGPCIICCSWEDLVLDYIGPSGKGAKGFWSWSEARRSIELLKYRVICNICYKVKIDLKKQEKQEKLAVRSREKSRNRRKHNRGEWLANNSPCVICGSLENLEVDHIDRTIKVDHRVWSWSEKRRNEELLKCQVLCKKCHLKKTILERKKG